MPATALASVFSTELLRQQSGLVVLEVLGPGAIEAFSHEAGGHRWQRVPPTEKRGRVQTSTVTVAVLETPRGDPATGPEEGDLRWTAFRGSGKGGQKRNKTASAVRVVHVPSGTSIRVESERSQRHNLKAARDLLAAKLAERALTEAHAAENARRRDQVGSGMRGDKRRTIRLQADQVVDHVTGRTITARRYLRGEIDALVAPPGDIG